MSEVEGLRLTKEALKAHCRVELRSVGRTPEQHAALEQALAQRRARKQAAASKQVLKKQQQLFRDQERLFRDQKRLFRIQEKLQKLQQQEAQWTHHRSQHK